MSEDPCKIISFLFSHRVSNKITTENWYNILQNIVVRAGKKRFSAGWFFLKHYNTITFYMQMQ